jgi:hypothetical protein
MRILINILSLVAILGSLVAFAPADTNQLVLSAGQEADVQVVVTNVANLYGIDVRAYYDPARLAVTKVARGVMPQADWVLYERTDVVGMAWYVAISLNPTLPSSGTGVVCTLRVKALVDGPVTLRLVTQGANRNGFEIPLAISTSPITGVQAKPFQIGRAHV